MTGKRRKLLLNPTKDELLQEEPLLAFSFYLSCKNNILLETKDEIIECLDKGFQGERLNTGFIGHASVMMWYWSLGAYEVVRTMCQAKDCFSNEFLDELKELKNLLAKVRMPSAKMEKKGKKTTPVNSNRSPDGWDISTKDLLVGDPEDYVSGRLLLEKYDTVLSKLNVKDIYKRHEEMYT